MATSVTPSTYTFYKNSTTGVSSVVGWESSSERGIRYTFTLPSSCTAGATSYSFSKANVSSLGGGSAARWNWAVSTSSTAYLDTTAAGDGYKTSVTGTFSGSANKTLYPGTTYYLFIYPGAQTYGWRYWNYPTEITLTVDGSITYSVTYNANGGSGTTSAQTKTYGTALTLRSNGFTAPTGYHFNGWNTAADGSGTAYSAGGSYTSNAAVTLYAQWAKNVVRLAYNINGGTMGNTAEYGLNDYKFITKGGTWAFHTISYGSSDDPYNASTFQLTRTGYSFGGWNSYLSSGGIQSTLFDQATSYDSTKYHGIGGTTVTTANTSSLDCYLYAKWNANSYTVTYNSNGGSGSMAADTVYYNSSYKTKQNAFTKTGYTFAGWNEKADGTGTAWNANTSGTYENGTAWTWTYTNNITLYAQWTINSYSLTLEKGTGISAVSGGGTKQYNSSVTINATVNTGYTWSKWTEGSTQISTTKNYTFNMPAGNKTYKANATANTYSVKYYGNGATSGSMADSSHTYDSSKKLSANAFVRKGYEFLGWATSASGDVEYTDQQSVKNLTSTSGGTINLYAKWKPLSQMFIWDNNKWHRALRYVYDTSS